jgi:hypothetical protein
MAAETQEQLNVAQEAIYTRTNIRRAFQDFDDSDVAGIYMRGSDCLVVRRDGSEQTYDRQLIKAAHQEYTRRLKDFFAYLGPNYRGPSVWQNNAYIMFKGWHYTHALSHLTPNAKLQQHWADKFVHLSDPAKVTALLQSPQTDLGHLVAPDGLRLSTRPLDMDRPMEEDGEQTDVASDAIQPEPWCSCGSFQRQLNNVSYFQEEIEGFKPWCIHLTWFQKYRELLCKRTEARNMSPSGTPEKCVAWWYAPPADHTSDGRFVLLYTKSGAQAPLSHWRTYRPSEVFTQHHAWDLFFNMMASGYVPFPGIALPQLQSAVKKQ